MSCKKEDISPEFRLVFSLPKSTTPGEYGRLWRSQRTPEQVAAENERRRRQRQNQIEQEKKARRINHAARRRAIYQSATAEQVIARREARRRAEKALRARRAAPRAGEEYYLGPMNITCSHCSAAFFKDEVKYGRGQINVCCNFGNVHLGNKFRGYPSELSSLLTDNTPPARNLRDNISQFNSALAMASLGVQLDVPRGNCRDCFGIHGQIYHYIGPLHPAEGQRPSYSQIYVMDTNQATEERLRNTANANCDAGVMRDLSALIARINPFACSYRMMAEVLRQEEASAAAQGRPVAPVCMIFDTDKSLGRRRYNVLTCNEMAVVYVGKDKHLPATRHLVIHPQSEDLQRIPDTSELADPLSYPIFFPSGEVGWHPKLQKRPSDRNRTRLTQKEYYCFLVQVRPHIFNPLHLGGPLFQQYVIDAWLKTEQNRLNYIRTHQDEIGPNTYRALQEFVAEDHDGPPVKHVFLPPSVPNSPRAMMQDYQDAMAIVAKYGKPDYFVTLTCNLDWKEIKENLLPGQTVSDRPDIVARVFKLKMDALLKDILTGVPLGNVQAYISIYKWQKCGLPCTHSWFIMEDADKPHTATDVDHRIRAELPDRVTEPDLYQIVSTRMIHRPCGVLDANSHCMRDGQCSKKFPKKYHDQTSVEVNGCPQYQRRNDGKYVEYNGNHLDNRSVISYNERLLLLINAHVKVEVCTLAEAVKYLYKYVYKEPDRASLRHQDSPNIQKSDGQMIDEIKAYLDARYVCAPESMHHLLGFPVVKKSDAVYCLAVHLPDNQNVGFQPRRERQAIERATIRCTTLTAWFRCNEECRKVVESGQIPRGFLDSRQYFYVDMPKFFTFHQRKEVMWSVRQKGSCQIGRMYMVPPCETERYALRLLLLRVKGALSFEHLRTVTDDQGNSHTYDTFVQAAKARGIFEDDMRHVETLQEASQISESAQVRGVFIVALVFMEVPNPATLWNAVKENLTQDFRFHGMNDEDAEAMACYDIEDRLLRNNLQIADFDIPTPVIGLRPINNMHQPAVCRVEGERLYQTLNPQQKNACDTILAVLDDTSLRRLFFFDGPGGSGKTYCYTTLFNIFVGRGLKVVCTAWTGIAANLLPNGYTSASLFKLDVKNNCETSLHKRNNKEATLLGEVDVIIWDEASMVPKKAFETANTVLQDITQIDRAFGGKIVILGGDFRQVLPVVHGGSRDDQIEGCITRSALWSEFLILRLITNMRVTSGDTEWMSFLLTVGNGSANDADGRVQLPTNVVCQKDIVSKVFGKTVDPWMDLSDVAILALNNVDAINTQVYERMSGKEQVYLSNDEAVVEDSIDALYYTTEFLNNIKAPSLPPHYLRLKKGSIVMLLRDLDVSAGLCNGTRYEVIGMGRRILQCRFVCGERKGQMVLIPRIVHYEDHNLPFKLKRIQFPVRLAFALSTDKAQGQSFSRIGLWLSDDIFSHGQLYTALSRVRSRQGLTIQGQSRHLLNVVYNEVCSDLRWDARTERKRDLTDIDHPEDKTSSKLIKLSSDREFGFHLKRQSSFASADDDNHPPFLEVKVEPTEITETAYSTPDFNRFGSVASADDINHSPFLEVKVEPTEMACSTLDFKDLSMNNTSNSKEFINRFASAASAHDINQPSFLKVKVEPAEITEMAYSTPDFKDLSMSDTTTTKEFRNRFASAASADDVNHPPFLEVKVEPTEMAYSMPDFKDLSMNNASNKKEFNDRFASADDINHPPFLEVKIEPPEITEMAYSTPDFKDLSMSAASNTREFNNCFESNASADDVNHPPFLEVKVEPIEMTEMAYSTVDFQDSSTSNDSNTKEFNNRFACAASADDINHRRLLEVILEPNKVTAMTEIHNPQCADPLALYTFFGETAKWG